mmetsp:Transcript_9230/g.14982  ORF Transcript_9230/g.14982 Transcript_9230/m.14982 type:complete len:167 (+) Transcript_9230:99-599(+)|eukprot:CAMPEP_0203766636 /NCGR_PEP_ID=MMETSP0099_2-20121227/534_1 /ASSEMBLY_ACC=CAM_ASM_000209 /TAXON_ID=96639 /ORGANISM=" , Strain NY0313808BC1" /LENGTH=166 /DNA_ID=CAMNT_0050663021 /DNA_START=51 /DNA_END=551 /DNA_ORIENTATION=-
MESTADLCDRHGDLLGYVDDIGLRDFGGVRRFHGHVTTVQCLEDNSLVKQVLQQPGKGRVLVVNGGGSRKRALVGDQIAKAAADNNWNGIVVNGCIRDAVQIRNIPIGLKALGTNPRKTEKKNVGVVGIDVSFGGVTFREGSVLVADEDGIVVGDSSLFPTLAENN